MPDENVFRPIPDAPHEDITLLPSEGHGLLESADTGEVLEMVLGDDESYFVNDDEDVIFGRGSDSGGFDISEWDQMPRNRHDDFPNGTEGAAGDELDLLAGGDEIPDVFHSPEDTNFPVFKKALSKYQAMSVRPRTVRIDTDDSHEQFMCERAISELDRQVKDLRNALNAHEHDLNAHKALLEDAPPPKKVDIVGAAEAVANLSAAKSAEDVAAALPKVPVDLPPFAEGKIKCWKDGDHVVCSIRFAAADGTPRVATMAAKPSIDHEILGMYDDPIVVLGVLSDMADVACGKKLVKDVAGAALKAHRRVDVCGMAKDGTDDPSLGAEPVFLTHTAEGTDAPVAALMHVSQQAKAGSKQARKELSAIHKIAGSHTGKALAPFVAKAKAKLEAHAAKAQKPTMAERYAHLSLML